MCLTLGFYPIHIIECSNVKIFHETSGYELLIGGTEGGGRRNTCDGGMKTVHGGTSSQRAAAEKREGREERVLCRCMQEDAADEIPQMAKCHATFNFFLPERRSIFFLPEEAARHLAANADTSDL